MNLVKRKHRGNSEYRKQTSEIADDGCQNYSSVNRGCMVLDFLPTGLFQYPFTLITK